MANYCYNHISIYGDNGSLSELHKKFKEFVDSKESLWGGTYHKLFKTPHPFYKEGKAFDVYAEYGSKWFEIYYLDLQEDSIQIDGDSAWSPVIPLCKKLSEEYQVRIEIEFEECGDDFGGKHIYDKGCVIEQINMSYHEWKYLEMGQEHINNELDCYNSYEEFQEYREELWDIMSEEDKKYVSEYYTDKKQNEISN